MKKKLLKSIMEFYSTLENFDNKWKELSERSETMLQVLKNQAEQLRPDLDNAELYKIVDLRNQLIFKIYMGIEDEISNIHAILTFFNRNIQELKKILIRLEGARNKLSLEQENMKELVNGTSYRPKLNLLLEWAIDACNYYQNIYCRISSNLKVLNYKDENSIENLVKSFLENESTRVKIDRILAYTQFLSAKSYY